MRVVFAGTPQVAVTSLEAILASQHEVVAVVTRPDAVAGRGHRLTPSPVSAAAAERGIPVLTPNKPSDPEFVETLPSRDPDCCPVVAHGSLIPQRVLDIPAQGGGHLRLSLLPAWPDAAALRDWANARLGKQQRIAELRFVESLPRNPNGKILKRELR